MAKFLFIYGYESPSEWETNRHSGTDDESSGAVWISAKSEADALSAGREFAEQHTASLFAPHPELSFPGWVVADYAYWIEPYPFELFSQVALGLIPEISSN